MSSTPSAAPDDPTPADPRAAVTPAPKVFVRVPDDVARAKYERKRAHWTWVPSQGHLYGGAFPGGEVVISPMTTAEEKILQQAGKDRLEIVDTLIQRCLVSCPVKYEDLLLPDMFYLLLAVRNVTYGPNYIMRLTCARCDTEHVKTLQVPTDLELRCLDESDEGEPWEVLLPDCQKRVHFRHLRVKDETDIRKWSRQSYSRSQQIGDPAYQYRIAKHITAINGAEVNGVQKLEFVEDMIGGDSLVLRRAIQKKEFGVRLLLDSSCPRCGHEEKTQLPFDREFFHPSDSASAA